MCFRGLTPLCQEIQIPIFGFRSLLLDKSSFAMETIWIGTIGFFFNLCKHFYSLWHISASLFRFFSSFLLYKINIYEWCWLPNLVADWDSLSEEEGVYMVGFLLPSFTLNNNSLIVCESSLWASKKKQKALIVFIFKQKVAILSDIDWLISPLQLPFLDLNSKIKILTLSLTETSI